MSSSSCSDSDDSDDDYYYTPTPFLAHHDHHHDDLTPLVIWDAPGSTPSHLSRNLANVPLDYGRSEKTKRRGARIEKRWHKYCEVKAAEPGALPKWSDAEEALRQSTPNDIPRFLNYCMKLKRGEGGRRLKGIKKGSALRADWKCVQGYYRRVTHTSFTKEQGEEINADLTEFNETVLQTTERRFHLGFERIQICLFAIIGIFTVNRIQALLALQPKHLQLSIQRDPLGGPPIPMVELRAVHTKQFLGIEQHKNFPLPEIVDDPSLIFSPHVFLFGILFSLDAFEAPHLRSMEDLRRLLVEDRCQQMVLPLRPEIEEYFLCCMTDMAPNHPMD
ncbi:hypothetical protein Egran_00231 [Elaphomyces granulatus]|uniref:Uncharacterized protein n=1 Tax=Elaphomyces granulatus TaxID=519963 RepID=A0A232M6J3_9EURO|nr:hypothetical protein Egran_00231 [Elaphomyces granulatus]